MLLYEVDNLIRHLIVKQNSSVHLCYNVIEYQCQNAFAELVLSKLHAEATCVAVLNLDHYVGIGQRALLRSLISHAKGIVMLHDIAESAVNGFYEDSFQYDRLLLFHLNRKVSLTVDFQTQRFNISVIEMFLLTIRTFNPRFLVQMIYKLRTVQVQYIR